MNNETPRIVITAIEVSDEYCEDVLVTCVEGGSNYWAEFRNIVRNPITMGVVSLEVLISEEEEPEDWRSVSLNTIRVGLSAVLQSGFSVSQDVRRSIVDDDNDAESSDLLLQVGLFGEVVYS